MAEPKYKVGQELKVRKNVVGYCETRGIVEVVFKYDEIMGHRYQLRITYDRPTIRPYNLKALWLNEDCLAAYQGGENTNEE
jgi:hypothetical protein